jgi:hypothetical protein
MVTRWIVLLMLSFAVGAGCSDKGPQRVKTFPVKGVILVDGKPAGNLAIECHNVNGMDKQNPTMSQALTDEQGKFSIGTYEAGDGVPAGDYSLTFLWGDWQPFSMTYGGPDKLKDRYRDPKTSPAKFTVKPGVPTELGEIKLTTE